MITHPLSNLIEGGTHITTLYIRLSGGMGGGGINSIYDMEQIQAMDLKLNWMFVKQRLL